MLANHFGHLEPRRGRDVACLARLEERELILHLVALLARTQGVVRRENAVETPEGEPIGWMEQLLGEAASYRRAVIAPAHERSHEAEQGIDEYDERIRDQALDANERERHASLGHRHVTKILE